jgi:hypothetical protein
MLPLKKKKKVDYEALNSALMHIPRMDIVAARGLLDVGIREIYDLQGRAPEVLMEEVTRRNPEFSEDHIRYFRMAVYYSENADPETVKMHPDAWH